MTNNNMKTVAIIQSNYIPWKGYFDLIHDVDEFLFYDDVQFTVRDWRNRNRIKTQRGCFWLTIPVGSDTNRLIQDVEIRDHGWQARHWRSICHCYARAPFFKTYEPFFRQVYLEREWSNLSAFNQFLVMHISKEFLGLRTRFDQSRHFAVEGRKQDRILGLLRAVGATVYHSGPAAQAYLDTARLAAEGIEVVWKDYSNYPEYTQRFQPFEHAVSILDLLFNVGSEAPSYIWGAGTASAREPVAQA